jgi:YHS domain-containing protein
MAKDLVCNMEVDEKTAKWKSTYKGEMYYFCAPACKAEFDENPEKYVGGSSGEHGGHHGCCCGEC